MSTSKIKKKPELSSEELKNLIVKTARKHFAQFGVHGVSLKDIATESGVASSLINYHFGDKGGLFKACIEGFAGRQLEAVNRLLSEAKSPEELRVRLELFTEEMIMSVMADPYGFEIVDHEVKIGNADVLKVFQDTLLTSFKTVVHFFKSAQSHGLINGDLDPLILAGFLFSSSCDACRKDHLGKTFYNVSFSQVEYRKKYARHVVTIFMNGVMK